MKEFFDWLRGMLSVEVGLPPEIRERAERAIRHKNATLRRIKELQLKALEIERQMAAAAERGDQDKADYYRLQQIANDHDMAELQASLDLAEADIERVKRDIWLGEIEIRSEFAGEALLSAARYPAGRVEEWELLEAELELQCAKDELITSREKAAEVVRQKNLAQHRLREDPNSDELALAYDLADAQAREAKAMLGREQEEVRKKTAQLLALKARRRQTEIQDQIHRMRGGRR